MKRKSVILTGICLIAASILNATRGDDKPPATRPTTRVAASQLAATQPGVTLINIHLHKVTLQEAFDELAKQGGVKFVASDDFWQRDDLSDDLDIDLNNRPFWPALFELCDTYNINPMPAQAFYGNGYNNTGSRRIQLMAYSNPARRNTVATKKKAFPTVESNGWVIRATGFSRQQNIDYGNPERTQSNCSVGFTVYVDPAVHISTFTIQYASKAVDDQKNSLMLDAVSNNMFGGNMASSMLYNFTVPLRYPEKNPGKKIDDLKFTLQVRASTTLENLTVDKALEAAEVSKDFGDVTVIFHSLKKINNGSYQLSVGMNGDDQRQQNPLMGIAAASQLLDSKGHVFNAQPSSGGGAGGTYTYNIIYSAMPRYGNGDDIAIGKPAKWVVELPTKTHALEVPVEFKDLPLP